MKGFTIRSHHNPLQVKGALMKQGSPLAVRTKRSINSTSNSSKLDSRSHHSSPDNPNQASRNPKP